MLSNHFSHEKSFFLDTLIRSLHCYIMHSIGVTFWDEFEPNFGWYFAFLFFGAFEDPSPHTPRIFMAVCRGHCLVTSEPNCLHHCNVKSVQSICFQTKKNTLTNQFTTTMHNKTDNTTGNDNSFISNSTSHPNSTINTNQSIFLLSNLHVSPKADNTTPTTSNQVPQQNKPSKTYQDQPFQHFDTSSLSQ